MKKCVWYISKYAAPPVESGSGGRGYLIMREIARQGHKAVIVTSDSNALAKSPKLAKRYNEQKIDDVNVLWIKTLKYSVAKSLMRILSWVDFEVGLFFMPKKSLPKPDAVIASSLSLLTIINGFILRKKYKCPLVFEVRDIWPLTLTEEGGFSRFNPFVMLLSWVEFLGYKYSDVVVGTMPNLKEHVKNVLGYERDVDCMPMGIDPTSFSELKPIPEDYKDAFIPKGKFLVAHAGTIGITNALDTFFECAELMQEKEGIHFLIVGDGDLKAAYQNKYGYLKNLSFAPKVPKSMVQSVLAECDLLYFSVHVSEIWRYGQSLNKVIDYMLSGKPILASYDGYESMINEAGCGQFVSAGDVAKLKNAITSFAAMDSSVRNEMGMRGRRWILDNRSYQKIASDYLDIMFPSESKA